MLVYIVTLLVVSILGILEYNQRVAVSTSEDELHSRKGNNLYYYLIAAVFLFVGGFRYQVGSDFGAYYAGFTMTWSDLLTKFRTFDEPLVFLLTNVCRMIWDDGTFVIFVENAITVLLVFKGIKDWEDKSWTMPFLMYILYCGWTGSFNGVRQALAGAFIFAFSRKAGKYGAFKYVIVCFIAFLMHKTAIFMLPVLILANRKIDFRQILIVLCVAAMMPYIGDYALTLIGGSLETHYALHSVNTLRIAVSLVPVLLIFFTDDEFREENRFLTNMALINAMITISTKNSALMYRFADYTDMYLMLFIPKLAVIFTEESQRIFKIITLTLFFIYFATEIQSGNGNLNDFQWAFSHIGG